MTPTRAQGLGPSRGSGRWPGIHRARVFGLRPARQPEPSSLDCDRSIHPPGASSSGFLVLRALASLPGEPGLGKAVACPAGEARRVELAPSLLTRARTSP